MELAAGPARGGHGRGMIRKKASEKVPTSQ